MMERWDNDSTAKGGTADAHARSAGQASGVGPDSHTTYASPVRLLMLVVASIFVAEGAIMLLISELPRMTPVQMGIFDASLLVLFVFPSLYHFFYKRLLVDMRKLRQAETDKDVTIFKLEKAIDEIKVLRGIIPICANCKKVRDDAGYWQQVEVYVRDRSEAEFSHSICPDCSRELYPGL